MNDPVVDVILLDVPVVLWAKSRAHRQAVLAEFCARRDDDELPGRLVDLVHRIRGEYTTIAETADAELSSAAVRHLDVVDVAYPVPPRAAADLSELVTALDEADEYVRKIGREDLVSPDDCKAFRRWYFGQIATQLDGGFPTPWPG